MNKAMQAAQKAAKKAIENQYEGLLTVTEYQDVTNPVTHIYYTYRKSRCFGKSALQAVF